MQNRAESLVFEVLELHPVPSVHCMVMLQEEVRSLNDAFRHDVHATNGVADMCT